MKNKTSKKPYSKPEIKEVKLAVKEAVLSACKVWSGSGRCNPAKTTSVVCKESGS